MLLSLFGPAVYVSAFSYFIDSKLPDVHPAPCLTRSPCLSSLAYRLQRALLSGRYPAGPVLPINAIPSVAYGSGHRSEHTARCLTPTVADFETAFPRRLLLACCWLGPSVTALWQRSIVYLWHRIYEYFPPGSTFFTAILAASWLRPRFRN